MDPYAHRRTAATLTVSGPDGQPVADRDVVVEQVAHAVGIGNIGFDLIALANGEQGATRNVFGGADPASGERLAELFLGLFDTATLPFYWAGFEPTPGNPDTERLLRAARWFADRGVTVKGHPLVWHTLAPSWLLALDDAEVERVVRDRVTREVTAFAGVIDLWDAINEVVILPVFDKEENAITRLSQRLGRVGMVRLAVETAREANPGARLVLNDFDLSPAYEELIADCLDTGLPIDAIGLQTHMHQGYRGEDQVGTILERFSRFGLPLQLTETTLVSGELMPAHIVDLNDYQVPSWPTTPDGEARQADEIVRHYRSLVAHPAVESITYWGLTDEGAWLGAPCGLVRTDGTPKPAYDALRALVRGEWWTGPTTLRTDAAGRVRVDGFAGRYRVRALDRAGTVGLAPGTVEADVELA